MKEGFWVNVRTGAWFEIDDHAGFLKRETCARRVGLPEEVVQRIQAMPYSFVDGPDRHAILYSAMAAGLVRVRGHRTHLTVECTLPLQEVLLALAAFLSLMCGPYTMLKVHHLPDGPFLAATFRDISMALERDDLASLFPPVK